MQPTHLHWAHGAEDYSSNDCSVARSLAIIGDRWTMLVLREAFWGVKRFDRLQNNLGIARNILADRLQKLVANGILERTRYQERPERFEYRLTQKGVDLWPAIVALLEWGDRYIADEDTSRSSSSTRSAATMPTRR